MRTSPDLSKLRLAPCGARALLCSTAALIAQVCSSKNVPDGSLPDRALIRDCMSDRAPAGDRPSATRDRAAAGDRRGASDDLMPLWLFAVALMLGWRWTLRR
jgi:hypothetical protein